MAILQALTLGARFDVQRVIVRAGRTLRAHGLVLALAALAIVAPTVTACQWLSERIATAWPGSDGLTAPLIRMAAYVLIVAVQTSLQALVTAFIALVMVRGEAADHPLDFAALARRALACAGPIALQSALLVAGIFGGGLLLLVPGLLLTLMWIVATPALVVEGLTPLAAFERSRSLTRGCRFAIFGVMLIWFAPAEMLQSALQLVTTGPAAALGAASSPLIRFGLQSPIAALSHLLLATLAASIYVELVTIKEGGLAFEVGQVFM